jgi:hypothetical protein
LGGKKSKKATQETEFMAARKTLNIVSLSSNVLNYKIQGNPEVELLDSLQARNMYAYTSFQQTEFSNFYGIYAHQTEMQELVERNSLVWVGITKLII